MGNWIDSPNTKLNKQSILTKSLCFVTLKELNLIFAHHFFSPPKKESHTKKQGWFLFLLTS